MIKRLFVLLLFVAVLVLPASSIFAQGGLIKVGGTVEGALANSEITYDVNLEAGAMVIITLESDDFDPYLELMDGDGVLLAEDDDSAGDLNAQIRFVAPISGQFSIKVRSWGGASTGAFALSVVPTDITQLVVGVPAPVALTGAEGEQVLFAFDAVAGAAYHLSTDNEDVDVRVSLYDPSNAEIAYDDDSGPGYAAYLRSILIPSDGTYVVIVEPYAGEVGAVNLTLEAATLLSLNDGPQTATIGENSLPMERFVYDFTPGRYRLTVSSQVTASAFANIEFALYEYIQLDFTDALEGSIVFDMNQAGLFPVLLDSYSWGSDVIYTVSIEPVG